MEFHFLSFPLLFAFLLFLSMLMKVGNRSKTQNPVPKLPPGPRNFPIIGSLHHLLGSLPHYSLMNLAKKHGPLMHLKLGQVSTIVISSPEVAREIMKTYDLNFSNRPPLFLAQVSLYNQRDIVFAPYGDYWRQLRKICILELLSVKRVQSFHHVREEEVSNLIQSISSANESTVNLSKMLLSLSEKIASRASFGNKGGDHERFISALKESLEFAGGFNVADFFPSLKFVSVITGTKYRLERLHRKFDGVLNDIIKEHKDNKMRKTKQEDHEVEDLVDVLLRLQEHGDLEFPLEMDSIKAVILDMFGAGTETSSTLMEWAMVELMRNPSVMEKAQAEVRKVLKGKEKITESEFDELSYLKQVIKETMRLWPPLPLLVPRESIERCEINGYEIPKKTRVLVNAWAIGRDPRNWENPEEFYPERFSNSSIDFKGQHFEFIPFGAGRRGCPGMLFGLATTELALANLLYYFDWKLPHGMKGEDLDMTEAFSLTLTRKSSLDLIATPHFPIICDS
ncbi:desmethyl-deoxy-podophyllotoxin synthase-like [Tasmannia lanceolata]|uniref:desmethyl-deoxy-podophyllotoxin synthase-like n=1 Tax=Tasmannia lanceolata TaxID=3420 RepID=UPI0040636A65